MSTPPGQNAKPSTPIPALEPKPTPDKKKPDPVQEASEESFPASDPPAHGGKRPTDAATCEPKPREPAAAPATAASSRLDKVDVASNESFPASDPPSGTAHA